MLNESRQAGVQIEITQEMIEAGVQSIYDERPDLNVSPSSLRDIFEIALRAALQAGAFPGQKPSTRTQQS